MLHIDYKRATFPKKSFIAVVIFTLISFLWLGGNLIRFVYVIDNIINQDLRITKLAGIILQDDEILTMSARMASVTGDMQWKERYTRYEKELDEAIKEASALSEQAGFGAPVHDTDLANQKLVDMEMAAFAAIEASDLKTSYAILFSDEYHRQKAIYSAGIHKLTKHLENISYIQMKREKDAIFFSLIILAFLLLITIAGWVSFIQAIRRWQASLEEAHQKTYEATLSLEQSMEKLRSANADLERFNYVTAHDLKEPLRTAYVFSELLEEECTLSSTQTGYIQHIKNAIMHMRHLIDDLLNYAKHTHRIDSYEEVDCQQILDHITKDILEDPIRNANATLCYSSLPILHTRKASLIQVFQNLVSNAIKYKNLTPPHIDITAEATQGAWIFAVKDNGIGIEEEYHHKIFSPFVRLHPHQDYPGNGIGLAICKKAIDNLGGKIWVESTVGKGSVFYFTIPIE